LLFQLQQVLAAAEAVVAATSVAAGVSGALLVGALALRQPSTVAAFEQDRLSQVRTLPEVLVDQASHRDSMMVVVACLPSGRRDSLAQSVDPQQRHMSAGPLQLLGNQTA
jgi:hypothetical protein